VRDTPVALGEPTFLIMYRPIRHRKRVPDLLSRAFTAGLAVFLAKEDPSDLDIDVPGPASQGSRSSGQVQRRGLC